MSNLAPNVSVEDIKAALGNIGGGIREVHLMSHTGQSLKARITFKKPPEGNQECISRFNGVKADGMSILNRSLLKFSGRTISVEIEKPPSQEKEGEFSFLKRTENHLPTTMLPASPRRKGKKKSPQQTYEVSSSGKLYSDKMV